MGHAIRRSVRGAGSLVLALATVSCSGTTAPRSEGTSQTPQSSAAAVISVAPLDRTTGVPTDTPVLVASRGGTLQKVVVRAVKGAKGSLPGVLSADGTQWRSRGTTTPGASYEVSATAVNEAGAVTETTSTFSTVRRTATFTIDGIMPSAETTGLTVGVGMPVMITFDRDISDRVAVERNLLVTASKPVIGAWHWFDSRTVHFRPKHFWPAHTRVRVEARLAGVRGGAGLYGAANRTIDFRIGRSQITRGSVLTHLLTVRRDDRVVRRMPMSAGQGGVWKYHTTSGIHLAMSREPVTIMVSPGIGPGSPGYYRMTVYNTVRISNSGEYVHSAPWSVGSQGHANVSHGCVNVSPADAKWFIDNTLIGDPIIITGSPRRLEPTNGWGHWQEDWKQWLRWSSLKHFTTDDA
ncbi:lipoprotein-anchoring transpeptidase ErfK/SrfK [Streptosporangium becharense]|uniref:Lipoprotein-anchoring transpeptidase ErfK/SrfK n=1 Tax=Streptosporangium becharense TaxID=1816182 RepID=A0A7W9MFJ0_9ACTN|nr:Ig-like domain-containing protein [Streptosporangium becharense]MBB2911897.1 lipoprotein-anchoring transpeptidase ErfK/SrfK [Streptosporangium becharense]MBB5818444.1 lipoprotein-anchoring transpeptidase ErfK/SrfK [Streptosporangium becharense]